MVDSRPMADGPVERDDACGETRVQQMGRHGCGRCRYPRHGCNRKSCAQGARSPLCDARGLPSLWSTGPCRRRPPHHRRRRGPWRRRVGLPGMSRCIMECNGAQRAPHGTQEWICRRRGRLSDAPDSPALRPSPAPPRPPNPLDGFGSGGARRPASLPRRIPVTYPLHPRYIPLHTAGQPPFGEEARPRPRPHPRPRPRPRTHAQAPAPPPTPTSQL